MSNVFSVSPVLLDGIVYIGFGLRIMGVGGFVKLRLVRVIYSPLMSAGGVCGQKIYGF